MRLLHLFRDSITVKVISLISLLAVIVFIVLIIVNSYWQREDTINQIQYMGLRTTDLIELNIEEPMLMGDNLGTHEQFARIDKLYDDLTVYLTDFRGNITYSTRRDMLRQDVDTVYPGRTVSRAVHDSLSRELERSVLVELDEGSFFMTVRSVPNEFDCYHCHGSSQPILGSMLVMQNIDDDLALLQRHQIQNVLLGLGCLLLLIFTLVYFLKKTVINRITSLHEVEMEVSRGNLDAQFKDLGSDELGRLAHGFALMVNILKQKIKEAQDKSALAEKQTRETSLAMRELMETQKKLVQSERLAAIGEAAAHLSHEIKNPLMLMAGFARQVKRGVPQNSAEQKKLDIIVEEARRLEKMLYQVRDFTRPRKLEKEKCLLNQLICDTLKIFEDELREMRIRCQLDLEPELPMIYVDKDQIKQVLLNLIKNSLEAMSSEDTLTIGSRLEEGFLRLWVEDTGSGIPQENIKNIFNPFFTTKERGSGLGLAVSYRIIQDHGGDMHLESKSGLGTRFILYLPVNESEK